MGCLFLINLSLGSVSIPLKEYLLLEATSKETWHYIIVNYRLPKAIAAIVGMGLSISLLMQTTI
jgi:iron complex transport system permease protein